MTINPNEAPEGYKAVPLTACQDCAFANEECNSSTEPCCACSRTDGTDVMFELIGGETPETPETPEIQESFTRHTSWEDWRVASGPDSHDLNYDNSYITTMTDQDLRTLIALLQKALG